MTARVVGIGLAVLVSAGVDLEGASDPPATQPARDESLDARLAEIDQLAARITDLTADFLQLKHTALLKKPLESRGSLRVKGSTMRWDTTAPTTAVMVIDDRELQLYSAREKLLEIYPMQRGLGQIAASPLPRLDVIREHFTIERFEWPGLDEGAASNHLALKLTPREDSLRRQVQEVDILLNTTTGCATAVRMIDPEGDELAITFKNIRTNTGVHDDDVRFDPPKGTTISRPLDPAPAATQGQDGPS